MKKYISVLLTVVLLLIPLSALGESDPRLDMRAEDDYTPRADTQYFTRYTPWLKMLHPTSEAEIAAGYHGGEASQQIRCLDISPADNNLVIFGTDTSGVWITTNGGELWYNTNRNMIPTEIADVYCHPTDKNIMFAYSVGTFKNKGAPGIYRSTNMGRSWTRVYQTYISSSYTDNLFACDNSGNIYAVTGQGIIRSTDSGETWSLIKEATEQNNSKDNTVRAASIDVSADGKTIIACYAHSGFSLNGINVGTVNTDGSVSWSRLSISGNSDLKTYSFAIDKDGRYIAGVQTDTSTYGLYISSDKGTSWTKFAGASGSYNKVRNDKPVVRLRLSENHLYASYNSADANCRRLAYSELSKASTTQNWEEMKIMEQTGTDTFRGGKKMFFSQGIDVCGNIIYLCTAGPNKSTDGGTNWVRKSSGFSGVLVQNFEMDKSGNLVLSATDGNIIRSKGAYTASGTPSFEAKGNFGTTVATMTLTDKNNPDRIICWYGNSNTSRSPVGIIVTNDGGKTYEGCTVKDGELSDITFKTTDPKTMDTMVLEYDETEVNKIYASCGTSTDNGNTWTENPYYYLDIDGSRILAWDIYGTSPTYNLMYSADKGASWQSVVNIPLPSDKDMNAFFDAEDSNIIWYRTTTDFGKISVSAKKKTSYTSKTDYDWFSNLAQNPKAPNHLLLTGKALADGYCPTLYESYDKGASWHVVPGFFGKRTIDGGITFSTTTNEVFIGSHNGIFVYEYDNFNYWQGLKLRCRGEERLCTVEKTADGKIIAPKFEFSVSDLWEFSGWEYNGALYAEGAEITVGN